jgi:sulfur-oxidizing protein SoxX
MTGPRHDRTHPTAWPRRPRRRRLRRAPPPSAAELDRITQTVDAASFREQGIAKLDRIQQDQGRPPARPRRRRRGRRQADRSRRAGHGEWPATAATSATGAPAKQLAQNGRGMTWSDAPRAPQRRQLLQLPPDRQGRDLLRHDRPEPVQLRQAARRAGSSPPPESRRSCEYTWARSTTARPPTPAPACRASATQAADRERRCAT